MSNSAKGDFKWRGPEVCCYNSALVKGDYTFYKSFAKNYEIFELGDFAFVDKVNNNNSNICRILTMYESNQKWHAGARYRGIVRWYSWPRKLERKYNPEMIEFDDSNEVIEDRRNTDTCISLENIVRKCRVIFAAEDEPFDSISRSQLNKQLFFLCRYAIKHNEIEPILSTSDFKNSQIEVIDLSPKKNSPLEPKSPECLIKNNTINSRRQISYSDNKNVKLGKENSSKGSLKKSQRNSILSPYQKNSVKRNLNDSFADISDSESNTPVTNYSIIDESMDSDKSIKLKLRVSRKNSPSIVLNKLSDAVLNMYLEKSKSPKKKETNSLQNTPSLGAVRRSSRAVQRKSYAELISPEKFTPTKRGRKKSTENKPQSSSKPYENTPRSRRNSTKPKRYDSEEFLTQNSRTPTNKSKQTVTPSKRGVAQTKSTADESCSPRKLRRMSVLTQEIPTRRSILKLSSTSNTPSKRVTLVEDTVLKTPTRSAKAATTPKSSSKSTPSNRAKLIREGVITPSVQKRDIAVKKGDTPLMKARGQLHVSYVPDALPCREREYADILNFVQGKLSDGCGGCMYVSGVPGTGKTATVTSVIKQLQEMVDDEDIPSFEYVNINGMRLTEPRQAYVEILKQLTGKTVLWEQAQSILDARFSKSKKNTKPIVMLVDELDILCTKRQDVVYNLLDWPTKANTQLVVVTIANTMDLPERLLMGRVTSRLGLTRLTFQPYSYKQLQEIVAKRLEGLNSFNPDAVQLVARKVASVSGDARRALDICRRAAEIAETEGPYTYVTMDHVNAALNAMITQPKVQAIKHCTRLEQLILQAVVAEVERTGVEETNFQDVFTMLLSVAALDGFQMVSRTVVFAAVSKLSACRLLLTDQKCYNMYQKIILNVSADDVYYALKED